ncbi:hypothetical protein F5144DRAFT_653394 [Chaetomium tenue]|uniref:Uncharacterized protein n=1 Tax=Chaetomium tenue TaxID=1854479 RepID=A0ACB7P3W2_9PEZI|nr:hypothetical protein F5144DRAFT_653394 [Chaetomium globosum]
MAQSHRWAPVSPGDYDTFLGPIKSYGRFLMERGSWLEFQDLFVTADMVCEEKNSLTWAHILNTASLVESEKGHAEKAGPLIEEALRIRERLLPPDDMDLSDAYNNYGFMLLVESQEPQMMREAAKYFDMARLLDENTRMDTRSCTLDISIWERPMQCLGIMLRRNGSMRLGGTTQRKRTGEERTSWEVLVSVQEGKYEEAKALLQQCLEIQTRENATHAIVSATRMKLGLIAMASGKADQAILELEAARVISETNANGKGDHGDVARALRLLADAHRQRGDFEEAEKLHAEAEAIRRRVQGGRYHTLPDTYESYQLMVWSGYR